VVLCDRVFRNRRGDRTARSTVEDCTRSVGVPEAQLDLARIGLGKDIITDATTWGPAAQRPFLGGPWDTPDCRASFNSGGDAQLGCDKGLAELPGSRGPDAVHMGEIGLGHLGELLQGGIRGRAQRPLSWLGRAGGQAVGWRACRVVRQWPVRRGGPASCPDDREGRGGIRCARAGRAGLPTSHRTA
jgi:hypothetical protein